jgi:hypothetical protein
MLTTLMSTRSSRGLFSAGERGENERVSLNYFLSWLRRKVKVKSDPPVNKCWRKLDVYFFTVVVPVNLQTSSFYEISFYQISHFRLAFITNRGRHSSVGMAIGYGLDDRGIGVRVPIGSRIFSSPQRPDRLWGPPSLLSNGYRWVKLTTLLQIVPRSRKRGSIHPLPHTSSWRSA